MADYILSILMILIGGGWAILYIMASVWRTSPAPRSETLLNMWLPLGVFALGFVYLGWNIFS